MSHKFDVSERHKLDNPQRREMLPPLETLQNLGLQAGDMMADIGCGIGYFTFPAASIVGSQGKVFGLDIAPEMIAEVEAEKTRNGINNIETICVDEQDLKLNSGSTTFALISNVLHEVENLDRYITEIRRILLVGGKLAVIEWEKKESVLGPPLSHRLDKLDLEKKLVHQGFKDVQNRSLRDEFYIITAIK